MWGGCPTRAPVTPCWRQEGGEQVGVVTSGVMSPCLKHPVGMGYISKPHAKLGTGAAAGRAIVWAELPTRGHEPI